MALNYYPARPAFVAGQIMSERQFAERLSHILSERLEGYLVATGEALWYRFIIDGEGKPYPNPSRGPTRGDYAFETDVLVKKDAVPLVVIETKAGRLSTHDVLTYSAKAAKHKEVYPYLRYGLLVEGLGSLPGRFFTHNASFDFALSVKDLEREAETIVAEVERQVSAAEALRAVLQGRKVTRYAGVVEVE